MKNEDCVNAFIINDIEEKLLTETYENTIKKGTVYIIKNVIDGGRYIGQTIQKPTRRWAQHKLSGYHKENKPLYRAMVEFGIENFTFSILAETYDYDYLNKLEIHYISEYRSFIDWNENGYNLTTGGARNKYVSKETREKLHNLHFGKPKSEEHNRKVGLANKGRPNARTNRSIIGFHNTITNEDFVGLRKDFYYKYNLDTRKVYDLLTSRRQSHKGWVVSAIH